MCAASEGNYVALHCRSHCCIISMVEFSACLLTLHGNTFLMSLWDICGTQGSKKVVLLRCVTQHVGACVPASTAVCTLALQLPLLHHQHVR
jgi:hypothetical protein